MKKIGLVVKNDRHATNKADELEKWLMARDIMVFRKNVTFLEPSMSHRICASGFLSAEEPVHQNDFPPDDLCCVISLGGDGTFLSAARWIGERKIPILGVKFGRLGFLAYCLAENLLDTIKMMLENRFSIQDRMRLQVRIVRNGQERVREEALNDIVISKSALSRLAHMETYVDGQHLTTYASDGLIIATPTGSTAYSLAAGGPVIHPMVPGVILTPICPFTLANRPLILPDSTEIRVRLTGNSSEMMLTIDGQEGVEIDEKDTIHVKKSDHPIQMINLTTRNYFDVLKGKLMWNGGAEFKTD